MRHVIEGYAKKSGIGMHFSLNYLMISHNVPRAPCYDGHIGKAEKQRQAFIDLKSRLSMGYAEEAVIVTLGVQESVNVMRTLFFSRNPL